MFEEEKKRQMNAVGRIEKIEVKYQSPVEEVTLVMNKSISTPADCAKHISEGVCKMSALALVDGMPWDMNRPLTSDCNLKLLNLLSPDNKAVNSAFWRTCSFILGAVIDSSFKDDVKVYLHSFPQPIIKSGSFIYDVYLELDDWMPSAQETRALSAQFVKLAHQELPIDRIETTESFALDMFEDNVDKAEQIPSIAKSNDNKVTLYRIGNHVDISKGPMIGNSGLIGRCTVAAAHKLEGKGGLYRFQGIALPKGVLLNHYAYGVLERRARILNTASTYSALHDNEEENIVELSARN